MKIIGHPLIPSPPFVHIKSRQDIDRTLAHCIIWWESLHHQGLELGKFCQDNQIQYAVLIHHLKDLIFYANLGATYLITSSDKAQEFQNIIKEYLLDSILLCPIQSDDEIQTLAQMGIDGVIYQSHLDDSLKSNKK